MRAGGGGEERAAVTDDTVVGGIPTNGDLFNGDEEVWGEVRWRFGGQGRRIWGGL